MIFRPCRDEEAIKPWSASSLPRRISFFTGAFVARWVGFDSGGSGATLMERATWTNPVWNHAAGTDKPTGIYDSIPLLSHTEASHCSFWIYRMNKFCHLCLAFVRLPSLLNSLILLFIVHLSSFIPLFGIFSPPSPGNPTSCSSRRTVYSQSSKKCWVASQKQQVGVFLASGKFVSSLCSIPQLSVTWKHPGKTG